MSLLTNLHKTILSTSQLAFIGPMICVAGCTSIATSRGRSSVEAIKQRLRTELPVGTTREAAEEWLQHQSVVFTYVQLKHPYPGDQIIPSYLLDGRPHSTRLFWEADGINTENVDGYITSIIKDRKSLSIVQGSAQIILVFDKHSALIATHVRWVGVGP